MTLITKSNTNTLADIEALGVMNYGGHVMVSSRDVARVFGKEHFHVLRDIQNLGCSESFNHLNFEEVTYEDAKGEERLEYIMTRDGFAFLAMGFTGPKAAQFKEAYIARFNAMEKELIRLREKEIRRKVLPANCELIRQVDLKRMLVNEYIEDRCETGEGYSVKPKKLYEDFRDWCFECGYKPIRRDFEFYWYMKQINGIGGDRFKMTGIKLR